MSEENDDPKGEDSSDSAGAVEVNKAVLERLSNEAKLSVQHEEGPHGAAVLKAVRKAERVLHADTESESTWDEPDVGDVFITPSGAIQILPGGSAGKFRVTDPTVAHPQDSRAGIWKVSKKSIKRRLSNGAITKASLSVEEATADSE